MHLPSQSRQVPPTPTFRLVGAHCHEDLQSEMPYREHTPAYIKPQFTDLWQSWGPKKSQPQCSEMWRKTSSEWQKRHILKTSFGLPYPPTARKTSAIRHMASTINFKHMQEHTQSTYRTVEEDVEKLTETQVTFS